MSARNARDDSGDDAPTAGRAQRIADKLDGLIAREAAKVGGRAPTYRELADRINALAGHDVISKDTIRNLHLAVTQKGSTPNPTVDTLDWLGRGFGVQEGASYFLDDARTAAVDRQLDMLNQVGGLGKALGSSEFVGLLQRASGLSEGSLHTLAALADRLKALEAEAAPGPNTDG